MLVLLLRPRALFSVVLFWLYVSPVTAAIVNRTIDDSFGDSQTGQLVTYAPATGVWADETCAGCAIRPDTLQAFKGTYTAATYNPGLGSMSITMQFNGTAIYVFFILANNAGDGITTLTLANMTLDGNAPELFQHVPDLTTTNFNYNSLAFSKANLINAQHTLVISTSGVNANVFVNFDYAIYTHDDNAPLLPLSASGSASLSASSSASPSASKTASNTTKTPTASTTETAQNDSSSNKSSVSAGAIAGGVIGGIAVLASLGILLFCLRRRNRRSRNRTEVEGYVPPPMGEIGPASNQQTALLSPFIPQSAFQSAANSIPSQGYDTGSDAMASQLSMPSNGRTPLSPSSIDNAYQGISAGNSTSSSSGVNYIEGGRRAPLRSVTSGDHLSGTEKGVSLTAERPLSSVEAIRQARQNEIDQRLRTVQQEMTYLASDFSGGERGGRLQPLRRQGTMNRDQPVGGEENEMGMAEMKEQLRMMREQIASLQEQQHSAWAQGLSDDPPPGYTPRA